MSCRFSKQSLMLKWKSGGTGLLRKKNCKYDDTFSTLNSHVECMRISTIALSPYSCDTSSSPPEKSANGEIQK